MSASFLPAAVSQDLIAAKARELKEQFGGRELLSVNDVRIPLGMSRMTIYWMEQAGCFIPRANLGIRAVRYHINDVAAYVLGVRPKSKTSVRSLQLARKKSNPKTPDAPKMGRPRKTRSAA